MDSVQLDFLSELHLPPVWVAPIPGGYGHWCCPHCRDASRGFDASLSFSDNHRRIGHCRYCSYEHQFDQPYGQTPNHYPETHQEPRSLTRVRTGFPKVCPAAYTDLVCGANCESCACCQVDARLHWRCDHPGYQQAPGIHWCLGCGIELGPWAEAHHWPYCGGPTNRCLRDADTVETSERTC